MLDTSFFVFFLIQQLLANKVFCMETRFWNIFKTAKAKTILESPNKVRQGSGKRTIFKRPVHFLKPVQC